MDREKGAAIARSLDMRWTAYWNSVLLDKKDFLAVVIIKYPSQNALYGLPDSFLYGCFLYGWREIFS